MKYNILTHKNFEREAKPLYKKYPSLKTDIQNILDNLEKELLLAADLGNGFKKLRLQIKSKGKGSRGGGRIITCETIVTIDETNVLFASIYDKNEFDNIDISILKEILNI